MTDPLPSVLGRLPSGLFILTASDGIGHETGMLSSWVQQASFAPPAITVAVNRERYLHEWLERSPRMAISILGESQKSLLRHFGRGFEPDEYAFQGLEVVRTPAGLPVLADALGWLEGRINERVTAGDHFVYLLELTAAGRGPRHSDEPPYVHIRKNGLGY